MTEQITRNGITLTRNVGYIYDLMFLFAVNFNLEQMSDRIDDETHISKEKLIDFVRNEMHPYFGEINEDLYVFFHIIECGKCLISQGFFKIKYFDTINFENFLARVSDKDEMLLQFTKFYFYGLDKNSAIEASRSKEKLFALIKGSKYTHEEKTKLYEFVIDPDRYIDLLIKELTEKNALLEKYYEEHYGEVIKLFNELDMEKLPEHVLEVFNESLENDKGDSLPVANISFCLLNREVVAYRWNEEKAFAILGVYFENVLDRIKKGRAPEITEFGDVICEPSRVGILNYMLEKGEVICKELEKRFNFSGTTAYHHLTMMVRVGIVKTRLEKKTVIYSLNRKYVNRVLAELIKYSDFKDVNEIK